MVTFSGLTALRSKPTTSWLFVFGQAGLVFEADAVVHGQLVVDAPVVLHEARVVLHEVVERGCCSASVPDDG